MQFKISAQIQNNYLLVNILSIDFDQYECAYYFFKDGIRIETKWYSSCYSNQFHLETPGAYYVTCFFRRKENPKDIVSENTQLFHYPLQARHAETNVIELSEGKYQIYSEIIDDFIFGRIEPIDIGFTDLEFAFYLMEGFERISSVAYSPYNAVKFELKKSGAYAIKCFIRRGDQMVIKTSPFQGYKIMGHIQYQRKETIDSPPFIPLTAPYTDISLLATKQLITNNDLVNIRRETGFQVKKTCLNVYPAYLIGVDDIINQRIVLSGIINEGERLIFGQKDVDGLEKLITSGKDMTTMIGKHVIYKCNENRITITCDFFCANSIFYYWDGITAVISNRLNLVLKLLKTLKIETHINKEYVAATMAYNDGLISGTNFLTELAVKNLYVIPVNRYLEITKDGLAVKTKKINYSKTDYDDVKYRELLYKARGDILKRLNNIEKSRDITHYKMSLSGGFDSRLNLSVILNNRELSKETSIVTRDTSTANDLNVSIMLTNYFDMKYASNRDFYIEYEEITAEKFIKNYRNFNNGMYHVINQLPGYAFSSPIEAHTVNIIGAFGETMRSRYYMNTKQLIKPTDCVENIVRKLINKLDCRISSFDIDDFYKAFCREIHNTPGNCDYEKFDNMNSFHCLRYHFNDLINKLWGDGHYYSLFMSPYLFEASRMLTMQERCNNKIMLDMCYILYPPVLSFPISSYGSKDEEITCDKWGNVIFDPENLPKISFNNDRSQYYRIAVENKKLKDMYKMTSVDCEYTQLIYAELLKLYTFLRSLKSIGIYFDDHLYWYIECIKNNQNQLIRIFSKLCGIYDQITISGACEQNGNFQKNYDSIGENSQF